jgi:hypothetical protein
MDTPSPRSGRTLDQVRGKMVAEKREKGFQGFFQRKVLVLNSLLKEMQKDMDEKMDVLINIQKNNKL